MELSSSASNCYRASLRTTSTCIFSLMVFFLHDSAKFAEGFPSPHPAVSTQYPGTETPAAGTVEPPRSPRTACSVNVVSSPRGNKRSSADVLLVRPDHTAG